MTSPLSKKDIHLAACAAAKAEGEIRRGAKAAARAEAHHALMQARKQARQTRIAAGTLRGLINNQRAQWTALEAKRLRRVALSTMKPYEITARQSRAFEYGQIGGSAAIRYVLPMTIEAFIAVLPIGQVVVEDGVVSGGSHDLSSVEAIDDGSIEVSILPVIIEADTSRWDPVVYAEPLARLASYNAALAAHHEFVIGLVGTLAGPTADLPLAA